MQSFTKVTAGHTCASLCDTPIMLRLLQIAQLLWFRDKNCSEDPSLSLLINSPSKYMSQKCIEAFQNLGFIQRNLSPPAPPDFRQFFTKELICLLRYTLCQGLLKYVIPLVPLYQHDAFAMKNTQKIGLVCLASLRSLLQSPFCFPSLSSTGRASRLKFTAVLGQWDWLRKKLKEF